MSEEQEIFDETTSQDVNPPEADPSVGGEETEHIVEKIVEINEDYKEKFLRAQADYQNLQRETAAKRSEWAAMSEWQILEEFIPVYDNFKKATAHQPESDDTSWNNWAQGIGFIKKQFADILAAHGITEIKTVGEQFDATRHEAAGEEESEEESGTIIREIDAGYEKNSNVLKVAKVIIAK